MNLYKKWINHLTENSMGYVEHLMFALFYSFCCLLAGLCLFIHGIFPCWFQTTGSDLVGLMANVFKKRKQIDDT
jgi:hypothetical protein